MRFLRQHPLAFVVIAGLLAGGLAIAAAQAPDNTEPQDFHGRTWLTASAKGGDQLVLVNGISGLIEGRSQGGATIPDGARFIDSTPTSALVGSDEGVTVVDSGTQEAVTKQGVNGERSALTDDLVVTLGRDVRVQPASLTGRARNVPDAPTPIAGNPPVVDESSAAWYLGRSGSDRVAVKVSGSAPTVEEHAVDRTTTRLLVIDGKVYAAGPKAIEQVDGSGSRTVAARSDVLPSVAVASGDLWASAEGRTVTVFDGDDERTVRTESEVTDLAVWHGDVVAATAKGAERVEGDKVERIRSIRSRATIHADGGMLWLTSKGDVVAIDRDQQQSRFRLRALDADLCIETCDAGDLAQLLKDQPTPSTEPEAKATTTTAPPRDLQAPSTEPELPTTTTTTTPTTTEPPPPSTTIDRSPRTTTPATEPKQSTTTERPRPTTLPPPTTASRPPTTFRPPPTTSRTKPTFRPPPPPTFRPPPPATTDPPPPTTDPPPPTTNPPPPTTDPPPPTTDPVSYGLTLNVVPGDSSAQATASVVGPARPCAPFGSTGGSVSWTGTAGSGNQPVVLRWRGNSDQSEDVQVTIPNLQSGSLTVRFSACGVVTSTTVAIEGASPTVGEITLDNQPVEGQPFSAFVQYALPSGWSVSSANWNGNGASCTVPQGVPAELQSSYTRQQFQANTAGPCHLSVVITFAPPNGGELKADKQADIEIAPSSAPASAPRRAPAQTEGTKPTG